MITKLLIPKIDVFRNKTKAMDSATIIKQTFILPTTNFIQYSILDIVEKIRVGLTTKCPEHKEG